MKAEVHTNGVNLRSEAEENSDITMEEEIPTGLIVDPKQNPIQDMNNKTEIADKPINQVRSLMREILGDADTNEELFWAEIENIKKQRPKPKRLFESVDRNISPTTNNVGTSPTSNASQTTSPPVEPNGKKPRTTTSSENSTPISREEVTEINEHSRGNQRASERERQNSTGEDQIRSSRAHSTHMARGDDTERNERTRENQRERQNSQSEDRRRRSRGYSTSDDRRVRLSSVSEDQTYIVVMEFEERHKNFLKCPEQIQEGISSSPIDNTHITDLRHNHTRGMLIFSINNKVEA